MSKRATTEFTVEQLAESDQIAREADVMLSLHPQRLDPGVFDLDIYEIRAGYRSAVYFKRAQQIMLAEQPDRIVTMQVFQKNHSVVCGVDEALAVLRLCSGHWRDAAVGQAFFDEWLELKRRMRYERSKGSLGRREIFDRRSTLEYMMDQEWVPGWDRLTVKALHDGDRVEPWEPVITIEGPYSEFAHLESVYLGVLARQTKIASNVARVAKACNGKPLLFFADRFDHYATQGGDGYAAHVGGAYAMATDAMGAWWGEPGMGTMPHALIAAYDGSTSEATAAFAKHYPEANLIALVDFTNDCVVESLKCLDRFGEQLWGVRLDTSETMVDASITFGQMGDSKPTGVNPTLVRNVRQALDENGGEHVKIIVSGGFNAEKISAFEEDDVPVDSYAVGSSLLQGSCDFTADVVVPTAKRGRWQRDASRLSAVV